MLRRSSSTETHFLPSCCGWRLEEHFLNVGRCSGILTHALTPPRHAFEEAPSDPHACPIEEEDDAEAHEELDGPSLKGGVKDLLEETLKEAGCQACQEARTEEGGEECQEDSKDEEAHEEARAEEGVDDKEDRSTASG